TLPLSDRGVEVDEQLLDRAGYRTSHLYDSHRIERASSGDAARERAAFDDRGLVHHPWLVFMHVPPGAERNSRPQYEQSDEYIFPLTHITPGVDNSLSPTALVQSWVVLSW